MDPNLIAKIAQLSSVLEVSGYPKPGNVHRTRDFDDMVFEDFLISGIAIGDSIRDAANHASKINSSISFKDSNLGKYILESVKETDKWIANNTNLGIIMLITPIAMSAAISDNLNHLKDNINNLIINTTVIDAIALYNAISIADAGGMGEQDNFDVNSDDSINELTENNLNIFDVLKISSPWDNLAKELTSKMPISFDLGYPVFSKLKNKSSLNSATVTTFLTILSKVPDTLISRKYGNQKANDVSKIAKNVLKYKNDDSKFNEKINDFDNYLFKNKLNPGTTADLTASSIMISYLADFF